MRKRDDDELILTTDALEVGEVREFESFEAAYQALYASLEPGGSIDLHDEDCALVVDEPCNCTPHRMIKGAQA
jgi:hypothetical protein